jgi:hypothetical protein
MVVAAIKRLAPVVLCSQPAWRLQNNWQDLDDTQINVESQYLTVSMLKCLLCFGLVHASIQPSQALWTQRSKHILKAFH